MTDHQLVPIGDDTFEFLQIQRAPAQVLAEAKEAAVAIRDVIAKKPKPVVMNSEQYLEYEDWQTVGRFYGITAEVEWTRYCEFGGARGFEARAVAKHALSGRIISAGESMCLNDESRWSARPKYEWQNRVRVQIGEEQVPLAQLRSMAQTRACAKALRNVLAWVVVLAGYKATPAEELQTENDGNGGHRVDAADAKQAQPQAQRAQPTAVKPAAGAGTVVTITVKDITKKEGTNDKGPWVKWTIEATTGKKYGTFDAEAHRIAREAYQSGTPIEIAYTEGKYGNDIQTLAVLAQNEPGANG